MHRSTYAKVNGKWKQNRRISQANYPAPHRHFTSEIAGGRERVGLDDLEALELLPRPDMSEAAIEARRAFGRMIRLTDEERGEEPSEDLGEGVAESDGESESAEIVPLPPVGGDENDENGEPGTRNFSSEIRIRAQQIHHEVVEDQLGRHRAERAAQQALERDRDALARIEVGREGIGNHGAALMQLNR